MARVILRSRHVTRDGERETNGGKRKGERKEDSRGDGERSVGTFWYRWRYQKTRNCISHTVRLASLRVARKERKEREEEEQLPSADRQVAEMMTTMREKEIDK